MTSKRSYQFSGRVSTDKRSRVYEYRVNARGLGNPEAFVVSQLTAASASPFRAAAAHSSKAAFSSRRLGLSNFRDADDASAQPACSPKGSGSVSSLPVIRLEPMPTAEIAPHKRTSQD